MTSLEQLKGFKGFFDFLLVVIFWSYAPADKPVLCARHCLETVPSEDYRFKGLNFPSEHEHYKMETWRALTAASGSSTEEEIRYLLSRCLWKHTKTNFMEQLDSEISVYLRLGEIIQQHEWGRVFHNYVFINNSHNGHKLWNTGGPFSLSEYWKCCWSFENSRHPLWDASCFIGEVMRNCAFHRFNPGWVSSQQIQLSQILKADNGNG